MSKRFFDIAIASAALLLATPLLLVAAIGIKLTSPGPILYRAQRIGRDRRRPLACISSASPLTDRRQAEYHGREFTMYKFRTMHWSASSAAAITASNDPRVFPFGLLLRATKIDELPQLLNVIKGDMALVGPRPESPEIVRRYYTKDDLATLQVPPGLTSPGSLYYYAHCENTLTGDGVIEFYVQRLLPVKLALDRVYIRHATVLYDIRMLLRTLVLVLARPLGWQPLPEPPEMADIIDPRYHSTQELTAISDREDTHGSRQEPL
jgi:lipopolysaccharide/colanic/teichoic acid biosynthesis glycosyltransferase